MKKLFIISILFIAFSCTSHASLYLELEPHFTNNGGYYDFGDYGYDVNEIIKNYKINYALAPFSLEYEDLRVLEEYWTDYSYPSTLIWQPEPHLLAYRYHYAKYYMPFYGVNVNIAGQEREFYMSEDCPWGEENDIFDKTELATTPPEVIPPGVNLPPFLPCEYYTHFSWERCGYVYEDSAWGDFLLDVDSLTNYIKNAGNGKLPFTYTSLDGGRLQNNSGWLYIDLEDDPKPNDPVPEPDSLILLASGILGIIHIAKMKLRKN